MEKQHFDFRNIKTVKSWDRSWLRHGEPDENHPALLILFAVGETVVLPGRKIRIQAKYEDSWGVQLFTEGQGEIQLNGMFARPLGPGDCILHLPDVEKKITIQNTGSVPLKSFYLLLERNWQIEQFFDILIMQENLLIHFDDFSFLCDHFNRILSIVQAQKETPYLLENISSAIFALLTMLSRNMRLFHPQSNSFTHILANISHSPHNYPTIESLMENFHVSKGKLYRIFHDNLGVSPIDYVIRKRLSNSMWLLLYTEMPIEEIALKSGYKNQAFYSNSFKKFAGVSPTEFRRKRSAIAPASKYLTL